MTPESLQMLFALLIGFAVAGMCSSGYQVFTSPIAEFQPVEHWQPSRQSGCSSCRRRRF
jgi:hypothetical protein